MFLNLAEGAAGLLLAGATLRDVFHTVVVPGESRGPLRIARRLVRLFLVVSRRLPGGSIGVAFAPLVLVLAFFAWMVLLMLAFALMAHALAGSFTPALRDFGDALYRVGGAMTTMGMGRSEPSGMASVVSVAAGFCGLVVLTLAVTYLLQVQSSVGLRDSGVLKLTTAAGQPPSAIGLLERYAALGCRGELARILQDARNWCAAVQQSHGSHPSLIYFRSTGTGSGWPATLGVFMDLALVIERLLEEPDALGAAVLLREQGHRLACEICDMLDVAPVCEPIGSADVDALCSRLAAAGYRLQPDRDVEGFAGARNQEGAPVNALSRHLGTPDTPLLPDES